MTDMTPDRLAELRAVAEAAFPVEDWAIWEDLTEGGFVHVGNARGVIPEGEIATSEDAEPNPVAKAYTPELGAHIATFDPPTVLSLIAALEVEAAGVDWLSAIGKGLLRQRNEAWDAIERVREAATEVVNQEDNHGRTHYNNCWKYHLHCLAAKIIYETGEDDE